MERYLHRIPDALLLLVAGVATLLAVRVTASSLREVVQLTEVHDDSESHPVPEISVTQAKEDAISLSSLRVLATSHEYEIRDCAMRILFTRATKSPRFLYGLRNDLGSEAPQIRYTALKIHDALLELVSSCPFTPLNRQRVAGGARVPNNCPVCPQLPISSDSGTLLSQAENNREGSNGRPRRFTFISVEAPDASDGVVLVTAGGRHRQLGDNPDQAALRRQRREAMVLNEGNRPVLQEDIIQRSTASFQDETDQNDVRQTELGLERLSTT